MTYPFNIHFQLWEIALGHVSQVSTLQTLNAKVVHLENLRFYLEMGHVLSVLMGFFKIIRTGPNIVMKFL
jgi:hypothetical protein